MPTQGEALIDTGSEVTLVRMGLLSFLNVRSHSSTNLVGIGETSGPSPVFAVSLTIGPAGHAAKPIELPVVGVDRLGFPVIIGLDVLRLGRFAMWGEHSTYYLALPA